MRDDAAESTWRAGEVRFSRSWYVVCRWADKCWVSRLTVNKPAQLLLEYKLIPSERHPVRPQCVRCSCKLVVPLTGARRDTLVKAKTFLIGSDKKCALQPFDNRYTSGAQSRSALNGRWHLQPMPTNVCEFEPPWDWCGIHPAHQPRINDTCALQIADI